MNTYLSEFKTLTNRITDLPPLFLLSCFVLGLTCEIRGKVQALQPLMLAQAAGLACLQEEKFLDLRRSLHGHSSFSPAPPPATLAGPPPLPPLLPLPPKPPPIQVKRLTPNEIASCRERGLCFNCDEKFHRGHRCAFRAFLLIADEDDDVSPEVPLLNPPRGTMGNN